jgi:hypothetical protein
MREGKVVRILDTRTVVIDLGELDGVQPGMRFGIFTPREDIQDPSTGVVLGQLELRKATVRAGAIYPRFTVASPPARIERPRLGGLEGERVQDQLNVRRGEIAPLGRGSEVRLGDRVVADESGGQTE